jgi:thiamine phosphate synthase YjbQ (UPF0047 family)
MSSRWKHVDEGPDDSASHSELSAFYQFGALLIAVRSLTTAKSSLFGTTVTVPITDGRMNLGVSYLMALRERLKANADRIS